MAETSRHTVCSACGAVNRVPPDRPAEQARCGSCHAPLFGGHPAEVSGEMFERHLTKGDLPVLVDLWAPWCGPCRQMAPQFTAAAGQLEPQVRLVKLNVDEEPDISARLGVRSIPTLMLLKGGQVLARQSGLMTADQIAAWTRTHLR
jgi:thioredoxin 2